MTQFNAKVNQLVNENTTGKQPVSPGSYSATKRASRGGQIFVKTFSLNPPGGIVGDTGSLFGIIEIGSTHPEIPDLINLIIEEVQDNFYYPKDLEPEQNFTNVAEQFEAALKNVNLAIVTFLKTRHVNLDLEKVNMLIALSADKELHFTSVGNIGALLFFAATRTNYKIINVLDSAGTVDATPDPLKMFSQVISGKMRPRDVLFITTSNIFDYFSLERIKNIITDELPEKGMRQLNHLLEEINSNESFGAVTLEIEKKPEVEKIAEDVLKFDYNKAASQDSIKELINTEKATAKLLTPSLMPEIKKYANSFKTAFRNYTEKIKTSSGTIYQKQKSLIKKPNLNLPKPNLSLPNVKPDILFRSKIKKATDRSAERFKKLSSPINPQFTKFSRALSNNQFLNRSIDLLKQLTNTLGVKFARLPHSSKILLVVTIILGLLFSYSIIWLGIKNSNERNTEEINRIIVEVENKVNEAQASLIFRDENLARDLLLEARSQITQVNSKSKAQAEQIILLVAEIEDQMFDLRHIVDIVEPVQIVNFQNLDSQASIASLALLRRNTLYTQNKNNLSIYKANLQTRILGSIFAPDANTGKFIFGTTINDNELLFFNEAGDAFLLNPNNDSLQNLAIDLPENSNIVSVANYNNRIYLLDQNNNQIYRYSRVTGGYGNRSAWISEGGINISDGVSIVVDGSVYVLKSNGEIIKFQNGRLTDFRIVTIDPPLNSPTKLKTTENSNFLYILDPSEKRVVVLDKEGNLVQQYFSSKFDNLKDFLVTEQSQEIFVLNGTVVYGLPAEHL